MALYNKKELKEKSIFLKIIKKEVKENFLIEIENLLSDYENSLENLPFENAKKLFDKYSIKESEDYILERTELLKRYLKKCIEKMSISDKDMAGIKKLNDFLILPFNTLADEIDALASPYYFNRIKEYLSDGLVSEKEKNDLEALRQNLRLSDSKAKDLYRSAVKKQIDSYTKPIFESEVFSPEDEKLLYEAAENLGLTLKFPPEVKEKLSKYRENWELLNGKLPVLESDILLQRNELLHFKVSIDWMEERSVTKRVNYSGFTYSTKIIGNLRWRAGTIKPRKITSQELTLIDSGTLYLTNKRFIFNGQHVNKTIALNKIIGFTPYQDGMLIEKETGKSPFFSCNCDIKKFAVILERLIAFL